ncbi:MAG: hypothetical protein II691_06745, partial [Muribaculaceae bacterium]|nr:hypothetical protein [Muribaculaceae bacterium]
SGPQPLVDAHFSHNHLSYLYHSEILQPALSASMGCASPMSKQVLPLASLAPLVYLRGGVVVT